MDLKNFSVKTRSSEPRNDFVFGEQHQYKIEIANTLEKRKEAYHLIYELYRKPETGFADFDSSEMWYSFFYAHPDTATFIVREVNSGEVVATLTAIIDSALGLPMEKSYPEQLITLRSKNRKCAEMISLGVHDDHKGNREILIQLIKFSYFYARGVKNVTDYLIMICPRHAVFYERKFMYKPIGVEKPCSKVKNKTVRLYRLDLKFAEEQVMVSRRNQTKMKSIFNYFETVAESQETILALKKSIKEFDKSELKYFFQEQRPVFQTSTIKDIKLIQEAYKDTGVLAYLKDVRLEQSVLDMLKGLTYKDSILQNHAS